MKFTKEEISLCKQVAERYRKPIKCGDWILRDGELRLNLDGKLAWLEDGGQDIIIKITNKTEIIPLWTISDCLEFLKKRGEQGWEIKSIVKSVAKEFYQVEIRHQSGEGRFGEVYATHPSPVGEGNTLLEACLKAILALLEEEK